MGTDAKVVVRLSIEERLQLEVMLNEPRAAKDRELNAHSDATQSRRRWAGVA